MSSLFWSTSGHATVNSLHEWPRSKRQASLKNWRPTFVVVARPASSGILCFSRKLKTQHKHSQPLLRESRPQFWIQGQAPAYIYESPMGCTCEPFCVLREGCNQPDMFAEELWLCSKICYIHLHPSHPGCFQIKDYIYIKETHHTPTMIHDDPW